MEGEEGGIRLSKRFSDKGGEVDYKTKSGTAWSHSYLNQKPWHPLSYPNQRRKWIAEQVQAQRHRRSEEVSREYAQEQEFFRQAALVSKKDKEKIEMMKAVSFMYVRPPGYNAESAKAAEIADESTREPPTQAQIQTQTDAAAPSSSRPPPPGEETKKSRPKDVFGRPLPTEQEFEVLKNAPRLETGAPARAKPFGVEVRNVKCVRCGTFGHQSGDRECPLKDAIMPNEESRLKRDDPLTAILAHTDPCEPLKWELKQKPGISPPRGGFRPDDPNQQIVADDIFDEYGGFLSGDVIPELLTNFSSKPRKKKSTKKTKHKRKQYSPISGEDGLSSSSEDDKRRSKKKLRKVNKEKCSCPESSSSGALEFDRPRVQSRDEHSYSIENSDHEERRKSTKNRQKHSHSYEAAEIYRHYRMDNSRDKCTNSSEDSEPKKYQRRSKDSCSFGDSCQENQYRSRKTRQKHSHSYEDFKIDGHCRRDKSRDRGNNSSEYSELDTHLGSVKSRHRHRYSSEDSEMGRPSRNKKSRGRHSYSYMRRI